MNIKYLFLSLILLMIINCNSQKPVFIDDEINLKLNQTIYLKNTKISINFDEIIEDSRCPKGVTCIWQGIATAKVTVNKKGNLKEEFLISNINHPQNQNKNYFDFDGLRFSFLQLKPEPGAEYEPEKLKIKVKKIE